MEKMIVFGLCFSSEFLSVNAILNLDFEYDRKASGNGTLFNIWLCSTLVNMSFLLLGNSFNSELPGIVILISRIVAKLLYFLFL